MQPRPGDEPTVYAADAAAQSRPSRATGPNVVRTSQPDEDSGHSHAQSHGDWDPNSRDRGAPCGRLLERGLTLLFAERGRMLEGDCSQGVSTRYLFRYAPYGVAPARPVDVRDEGEVDARARTVVERDARLDALGYQAKRSEILG